MALKIRLSRGGAKKRPYYRVVVADSRKARDGRFIERIGSYNPMVPKDHPDRFKLDEDRAKHWMSVGATPSDRVAHLMNKLGLADKPVVHEQTKQHLPKAKCWPASPASHQSRQKTMPARQTMARLMAR